MNCEVSTKKTVVGGGIERRWQLTTVVRQFCRLARHPTLAAEGRRFRLADDPAACVRGV